MSLDDHQKLTLQTNLARDRAENLLAELRRAFAEAQADAAADASQASDTQDAPERTPEQVAAGEETMRHALAAAERMLANLNAALDLAEQGFEEDEGGDERERDEA